MYTFTVSIARGRGIPTPQMLQSRNTAVCIIAPSIKKPLRTPVDEHSLFPIWNSRLTFGVDPDEVILFEVVDFKSFGPPLLLATLKIKASDLAKLSNKQKWYLFENKTSSPLKVEVKMGVRVLSSPQNKDQKENSTGKLLVEGNPMDSPLFPPPNEEDS